MIRNPRGPGRLVLAAIALLVTFAPTVEAQRIRQLSEFDVFSLGSYDLDDSGNISYFLATYDPLGANPRLVRQVFRKTLPGGAVQQITSLTADAESISASDDGAMIAFVSRADPLGTNADGNRELFLAAGDGSGITQLTSHPAGEGDVGTAMLCGDASRVVFTSSGNLTGQNTEAVFQVFVIDADGNALAQLTDGSGGYARRPRISDNGQRIVFLDTRDFASNNPDGSTEVFKVTASGAGLKQVSPDAEALRVELSGDGGMIAYTESSATEQRLYSVGWTSSSVTLLTELSGLLDLSMTDDGSTVYYESRAFESISRIDTVGGSPMAIWGSGGGLMVAARTPVISGGGSRLLATLSGEDAPFLTDPVAVELVASDGSGLAAEQVADVGRDGDVNSIEMTADGSRVVFAWGGGQLYAHADLYLSETSSEEVTRLTEDAGPWNPTISDDGNTIVFVTVAELVPDDCISYKLYRVGPDGTGLERIFPVDPCPGYNTADHPSIAGDGSIVAFQGDETGIPGPAEVLSVVPGGSVEAVTFDDDGLYKNPRIDGTGTWTVYNSGSNVTGQNPDNGWEVFRARMDGTGLEQITADPDFVSQRPDGSADGTKIVYHSQADPLGTNADHNYEIFLYDTATSMTEQLTETTEGDNLVPRISPHGNHVAFQSDSPLVTSEFDPFGEVFRIELATGDLRLASAGVGYASTSVRDKGSIDVDEDGNVAFVCGGDLVRRNPDENHELCLAEFDEEAEFHVGAASPTVLQWDPTPWALSYDVIRGDLGALAPGPGGTIDLGTVACIENDSEDASTIGNEDPAEPGPGQGFFYLYRGDPGDLVGTGSWGRGSSGGERVPASGSCPD